MVFIYLKMKLIVVFAAVVATTLATISESDVSYYFYTRENTDGTGPIHIADIVDAASLSGVFNPSLDSVVLFHGWQDDHTAESNTNMKPAILNRSNVNVILVSWGSHAKQIVYKTSRDAASYVGRYAAKMILKLVDLYGYSTRKVIGVGFSLGAHAAGNMGAGLGGDIPLIVGLDPAGPSVDPNDTDYALDPTDADYVLVIHTNTALLGILAPIGHSDYYMNGGATQPGCKFPLTNSCSHNRAWAFLVESLVDNGFLGKKCDNKDNYPYTASNCVGDTSYMGFTTGLSVNTSASGVYYLSTNSDSPYALF